LKVLWRISRHCDLNGLGGERTDGRWHTAGRGKRIVYLSEHPALALVEVLANLKGRPGLFPDRYQLMKVHANDRISTETVNPAMIPDDWRNRHGETRSLGNSWLAGKKSALLAVPSAPSPESWNYLLNPLHVDAAGLEIEWCKWVAYDQRLFRI
jgi:RES domain-containing protein